ncbi:MAG: FeoB-associated Cys-rich membrane protein [Bacteroidales bacterium]|nr:FeoB-associated Cys-rich membrane protein [Candidatus Cacconaster equi]
MNVLSYIVIALIIVALVFAIRGIRKNRCVGGCSGCPHRDGCLDYHENKEK